MTGKGLLNYTTTVPVARTVAQMQDALARHGAQRVVLDYTDGRPTTLTFQILGPQGLRTFTLPVDVVAVEKVLADQYAQRRIPRANASSAQAERTAWRVAAQWVDVQLALVQTSMATLEQVMLPYLVMDATGATLYQRYVQHGLRSLDAGGDW